ncbi:hypothetical protein CSC28_2570 [Pseudomonas paraeruginosa]|nr:hypothetical protein CSC28_2570 [Pseudomonas paraeruginosa]
MKMGTFGLARYLAIRSNLYRASLAIGDFKFSIKRNTNVLQPNITTRNMPGLS